MNNNVLIGSIPYDPNVIEKFNKQRELGVDIHDMQLTTKDFKEIAKYRVDLEKRLEKSKQVIENCNQHINNNEKQISNNNNQIYNIDKENEISKIKLENIRNEKKEIENKIIEQENARKKIALLKEKALQRLNQKK